MIPLAQADQIAEKVLSALTEFCDRIEIAGSVRRRRPFVNDLDFVAIVKPGKLAAFKARCTLNGHAVTDGEMNYIVRLGTALKPGVQLDFFLARPDTRDLISHTPTNYGSLLLCRTGSAAHNIYLVEHAKTLGLRWNPYYGVYDGRGKCLASAEEADIFRALQLDFIPPEKRER